MKKLLCALSLCVCISAHVFGQFSYGVRATAGPSVDPGTNARFLNRGLSSESLVNISNVQYSPQIGLLARYDMDRFWLMSELLFGQSTSRYNMVYTNNGESGSLVTRMDEKRNFLEVPASLGVSLGMVEVFSGFSLSYDVSYRSQLNEMSGFESSVPRLHYGWHSGVGVNLGNILIDARYLQEFGNYGEGRFIDGQEILLKNAPGRFVLSAGYRITG